VVAPAPFFLFYFVSKEPKSRVLLVENPSGILLSKIGTQKLVLDSVPKICYYVIVPVIDNGNDNGSDMRKRAGRATIKEVASSAGVSTQTVSRVINDRPDVSPETRKRVQEIIDDLDYQPSALARSLIRQRSHTLGVVTAGLRLFGPSRTLSGIAAAAEEAGYSLLLKELAEFDANDVMPIIQSFLSRHVDGIIWAVPEVGQNHLWVKKQIPDFEIPLVFITMEPRKNTSIVYIDNYLGGRMATSHLLEQGYKHIAHISGPLDWWEARQRKAGWKDTLVDAGLPFSDKEFVEGNWSAESGGQGFEKLLKQYPEMDSVFVGNDRGLRIPEDIGVVGFDDIPESAFFCPPLTTISQDQTTAAKSAVKEIINTIESTWNGIEPGKPKVNVIPPTLVVRQSSSRKVEEKEVNSIIGKIAIPKKEVPAQ
jgi:DNA-binding LacI/PurR family transcriptional regulator